MFQNSLLYASETICAVLDLYVLKKLRLTQLK